MSQFDNVLKLIKFISIRSERKEKCVLVWKVSEEVESRLYQGNGGGTGGQISSQTLQS